LAHRPSARPPISRRSPARRRMKTSISGSSGRPGMSASHAPAPNSPVNSSTKIGARRPSPTAAPPRPAATRRAADREQRPRRVPGRRPQRPGGAQRRAGGDDDAGGDEVGEAGPGPGVQPLVAVVTARHALLDDRALLEELHGGCRRRTRNQRPGARTWSLNAPNQGHPVADERGAAQAGFRAPCRCVWGERASASDRDRRSGERMAAHAPGPWSRRGLSDPGQPGQ
jgi:hypothetical protein